MENKETTLRRVRIYPARNLKREIVGYRINVSKTADIDPSKEYKVVLTPELEEE